MAVSVSIPLLLFGLLWSHGVLGQSSTPVNTQIQSDPHFIGWYIAPTTVQALTDPLTWYTSGGYAVGCTASDACTYATNCINNLITYDNGVTSTCNQCRTMTIYESSPFAYPTASNLFCAQYWEAYTVYREYPATTTSSIPMVTQTKAGSHPHLATPTSTSSSAASSTASAGTDGSAAGSNSSSKAWIAGAVIGPIAGLAIIAGIIAWLVVRRRRQNPQNVQPPVEKSATPPPQAASPPQELEATNPTYVYELGSEK